MGEVSLCVFCSAVSVSRGREKLCAPIEDAASNIAALARAADPRGSMAFLQNKFRCLPMLGGSLKNLKDLKERTRNIRQAGPETGPGLQAKVLEPFEVHPPRSAAGPYRGTSLIRKRPPP
jgi:hypothetical protein